MVPSSWPRSRLRRTWSPRRSGTSLPRSIGACGGTPDAADVARGCAGSRMRGVGRRRRAHARGRADDPGRGPCWCGCARRRGDGREVSHRERSLALTRRGALVELRCRNRYEKSLSRPHNSGSGALSVQKVTGAPDSRLTTWYGTVRCPSTLAEVHIQATLDGS